MRAIASEERDHTINTVRNETTAPPLARLRGFFAGPGRWPAYLVGGYLRDLLLGRPSRDVDLAVPGDALRTARRIADEFRGAYVALDPQRGYARVVLRDAQGVWHLDITRMEGSLEDDLGRRDFTINAMALPLEHMEPGQDPRRQVMDPFDGLRDLDSRLVRLVREDALEEDPVRLLRGPRLARELGFSLEPATREALRRHAPSLARVARERVREEFLQLLAPPMARDGLLLLDELALLAQVVPELEEGRGVSQPREHYWAVLRHNLETVGATEEVCRQRPPQHQDILEAVPWDAEIAARFAEEVSDGHTRLTLLKLGALLHDVAKPATRTVETSGRIRFLGHHKRGAEVALAVCRRLRVSARGANLVAALVEHHLRPSQMSPPGQYPTPRAVYRFFRDAGDAAVDVLYLAMADYLAARGPLLDREDWFRYASVVSFVLEQGRRHQAPRRKARLVTGHDLVQELGISPGPRVGRLLDRVDEAQATGEVATREEALAMARQLLKRDEGTEERV